MEPAVSVMLHALFVCFFSWYLSEIRPDAHVCPICCLIMDESKTEVLLATLLYPPFFLLICKAACCKFVLKVSKIGGGALPGFTCGTVTPQLVQLCVSARMLLLGMYGRLVLWACMCAPSTKSCCFVFFCGAVLFLSCFFHFLSYGFLGTLYYEILHVFFVGLIHSPCS